MPEFYDVLPRQHIPMVPLQARMASTDPIINFNTPDPKASFDAYVGGDNVTFGRNWAQYLVDKGAEGQLPVITIPTG